MASKCTACGGEGYIQRTVSGLAAVYVCRKCHGTGKACVCGVALLKRGYGEKLRR